MKTIKSIELNGAGKMKVGEGDWINFDGKIKVASPDGVSIDLRDYVGATPIYNSGDIKHDSFFNITPKIIDADIVVPR